ncbi:Blastomyces -phase-specific protein [Ascosphaera apis ARSEF 7405]|uniref:Blastomyces-phase-specific protein n=1 Tax=Ascosphaera apis ARSEF 7405 TaxID=392613 RepID=A0A167X3K2_9EURO|nr:Blastomyces -phase-specific protein [Ascosphaera apis ARSEF 7405]
MIFSTFLTFGALAGLISSTCAQNVGTLIIQNNCATSVTAKEIDSYNAGNLLQSFKSPDTIAPNEFKSYPWKHTETGASVVVTRGAATSFTKMSYTIGKLGLKYSLTDINGHPFQGDQVLLETSTEACAILEYPKGIPVTPTFEPECDPRNSLTLTLCAQRH